MSDLDYVSEVVKLLVLDLMAGGISPPDIIEGIEKEVSRFESLVFDYE